MNVKILIDKLETITEENKELRLVLKFKDSIIKETEKRNHIILKGELKPQTLVSDFREEIKEGYKWAKDGNAVTRVITQNNISKPEFRAMTDKKRLIYDIIGGNPMIYEDEYQ